MNWINIKTTKPTRDDGDDFNWIFVYDKVNEQAVIRFVHDVINCKYSHYTHWMRTGFKRPEQPPDPELDIVQDLLVNLISDVKTKHAKDCHSYEHVVTLDELTTAGNRALKEYKSNRGIE